MAFVCHVFHAIKGLLTYLLNSPGQIHETIAEESAAAVTKLY